MARADVVRVQKIDLMTLNFDLILLQSVSLRTRHMLCTLTKSDLVRLSFHYEQVIIMHPRDLDLRHFVLKLSLQVRCNAGNLLLVNSGFSRAFCSFYAFTVVRASCYPVVRLVVR